MARPNEPEHLEGRRIGPYQLAARIGAGGMGEVYKALDTRLDRTVAIKVLPAHVAHDAQARERFEREARAVAALNHPHICTLYDVGRHEGIDFLVMEYLDGPTLAERLEKGPLPVDQALPCAIQIAAALDKAHRAGIVHRDLKPGNIILTKGGAKLLDFGLAKGLARLTPASPTAITEAPDLTEPGLILGTVRYMAPEQIVGKDADARTDIFAFGAVMFEMLTGRKVFEGSSNASVMAAILEREPPPLSTLIPLAPRALDRIVSTCLAKDPDDRWQTARDLLRELQWLVETGAAAGDSAAVAAIARPRWSTAVRIAGVAGATLTLAGAIWIALPGSDPVTDDRVTRFVVDLGKDQLMLAGFNPDLALSPDGTQLAMTPFLGPVSIRRFDGLEPRDVPASVSPGFRGAPLFSPDGTAVSFIEGNTIFSWTRPFLRAAVSGGGALKLAEYDAFHKGDWAADKWIYWTARYPGGIVRIPEAGGNVEPVTALDADRGERSHRFASLLPGEQALVYTVAFDGISSFDDARIDVWDLNSRQKKTLITGGTSAVYSPSGHLVYARAGKLLAVPFDVSRRQVTGSPFEALDGVLMSSNTGAAQFSLSRRGDLAYVPGAVEGGHRTLVWVDRSGKVEPLPLKPASYVYPHLSPDGRALAVEIEGPNHDLHLYDFARTVLTKITTDGQSHAPVWTPDSKRIAFRSWQSGGMTLWMMPADRSAGAVRLDPAGARQSPVSVSPDGRFLAFDQKDARTGDDAWVLPLDGSRPPQLIAASRFGEGSAKFSPDGHWIAYSSDESGREEVYVQPFPGPGPKIQISNAGGYDPVWRRAGGDLYYRSGKKMMVVAIVTAPALRASAPRVLWQGTYSDGAASSCGMPGVSSSNYDVTADGQRFLMVRDDDSEVFGTRVVVVLNWAAELKARGRAKAAAATAR